MGIASNRAPIMNQLLQTEPAQPTARWSSNSYLEIGGSSKQKELENGTLDTDNPSAISHRRIMVETHDQRRY